MAARNSNKKDENNLGFNIKELKEICMKYKKYIAAGAMVILLAVVISTSKAGSSDDSTADSNQSETNVLDYGEQGEQEEFEVDAYPEVNQLFEDYYGYYASGDTDAIEKIAFPITDTEKSYIEIFSRLLDKYDNIKCYTKKGIADGEYLVQVSSDMVFKDVKTAAPNLDFFYVRKNESGSFYIDNAYSQFNQSKKENTTENEVNELITEFDQQEDVIALQKEVHDNYLKALEKDEELNEMVTNNIQDKISSWVASFDTQTDDNNEKTDENKTDETEQKEQTRTAYATKDVNMREKRTINSDTILTLKKGSEVTIYGASKNGWFKIKYKNKTGFARKEYFTTDQSKVKGTKKKDTEKTDTDNKTDNQTSTDNKKDNETSTGSTSTAKRTAYAKETVRMRRKPSTDSAVVRMLKPGAKVTIYGTSKDGWFKVKKQGKTGYIKKEYLTTDPSKVKKDEDTGTTNTPSAPSYYAEGAKITLSDSVNVRKSMSETADKVGVAFKGDVLTVVMSYAEGWTKVSWNGETGYVKTEYLK